MLGPIEDHRTTADTVGEILVIAVVSALVSVALLIKLAGGSEKILNFDPGAVQVASEAAAPPAWEDFDSFTVKTEDTNTSQP